MNLHTVVHSGCNNLYSHQQYTSLLFSQHYCQYFSFVVFLIIALFIGMRYHLTVVLIYISLMISDFEHFSCTHWSSVCLLWKNVYSGVLSIF